MTEIDRLASKVLSDPELDEFTLRLAQKHIGDALWRIERNGGAVPINLVRARRVLTAARAMMQRKQG
jgi:hypothetical protein